MSTRIATSTAFAFKPLFLREAVGQGLQHSIPVLSYFQSTSLDTQKSSRNHDEALAPLVAAGGDRLEWFTTATITKWYSFLTSAFLFHLNNRPKSYAPAQHGNDVMYTTAKRYLPARPR
jgi:hypothetical protein